MPQTAHSSSSGVGAAQPSGDQQQLRLSVGRTLITKGLALVVLEAVERQDAGWMTERGCT